MAKKALRKARAAGADGQQQGTPALDKIAALLGLLVVKDMQTDEASSNSATSVFPIARSPH